MKYNMTDITIRLDDKIELDTIVKESNEAFKSVSGVDSSFEKSSIQTHTGILNPTQPGEYTITINGQQLSIKVLDPSVSGIIDDFEDQNLTEYPYNQGDDWGIVSGGLTDDSNYHLKRTGTSSGQSGPQMFSVPGDGLERYPKKGDRIEYYFQDITGSQAEFRWSVPNSNEENPGGYELEHGNKNNNLTLAYRDDNYNSLESVSNNYNNNVVYRVEIDWTDPIEARIYDTSTGNQEVSLSHPEPTNATKDGGIGFSDNGPVKSGSCAFDMLSIKPIN